METYYNTCLTFWQLEHRNKRCGEGTCQLLLPRMLESRERNLKLKQIRDFVTHRIPRRFRCSNIVRSREFSYDGALQGIAHTVQLRHVTEIYMMVK